MLSAINFVLLIFAISKSVETKSFTLILDSTGSMRNEIEEIQQNVPDIMNLLTNMSEFNNYVLISYNDADSVMPLTTTNPYTLMDSLNNLRGVGGKECPEDSLSAIQKALEISEQESLIYLFTDGNAKFVHQLKIIENLCRETRSQIVIFLTGSCSDTDSGGVGHIDVYYDIARLCSGTVFKITAVNIRKAFKYIKDIVKTDYNNIVNHEPFNGYKQFNFTVDPITTNVLITLSGDYPLLQICDTNGYSPAMDKIVDTRQSLVVRVSNLETGSYTVTARSQGSTYLTFYMRNKLPFEYGFAPRFPNSLQETCLRPMPGRTNHILISVPEINNFKVNEALLEFVGSNLTKRIILYEHPRRTRWYTTTVLLEPEKAFRMTIIGKDITTYNEITGSTIIIQTQNQKTQAKHSSPTANIIQPDKNLIDYGENATLVCKVSGYPRPQIRWEDEIGNHFKSEEVLLEIPSTYLSYVNIENMSANFTLYCKTNNIKGEGEDGIQLFVNRPYFFEVLNKPSDRAIEYGSIGDLYCEVKAYPEAEIKWYHNGTRLEYSDNIEISDDEILLRIKNMTLDDVGNYTCEASNEANRQFFSADITITGIELPEVNVLEEVLSLPENYVEIKCSVKKGKPKPEISWEYRPSYHEDFGTLPEGVSVDENILSINSANIGHKGHYKCIATNIVGEGSSVAELKIRYAPKITIDEKAFVEVMGEDLVELPCEVDAIPEATVRWEMYQGDVIVNLGDRHITKDNNSLMFTAQWNDSGSYYCIAKNEVGVTQKNITLNVLEQPYIQEKSRNVTIKAGTNTSFSCNVLFGNPTPNTVWQFVSDVDSVSKVLLSGSTNVTLYLNNVSKADEGLYFCIIENKVGKDRIRIHLSVH